MQHEIIPTQSHQHLSCAPRLDNLLTMTLAMELPPFLPAPARASKAVTRPSSADTRKHVGLPGFHVSASTSADTDQVRAALSGTRTSTYTKASNSVNWQQCRQHHGVDCTHMMDKAHSYTLIKLLRMQIQIFISAAGCPPSNTTVPHLLTRQAV